VIRLPKPLRVAFIAGGFFFFLEEARRAAASPPPSGGPRWRPRQTNRQPQCFPRRGEREQRAWTSPGHTPTHLAPAAHKKGGGQGRQSPRNPPPPLRFALYLLPIHSTTALPAMLPCVSLLHPQLLLPHSFSVSRLNALNSGFVGAFDCVSPPCPATLPRAPWSCAVCCFFLASYPRAIRFIAVALPGYGA
jgi:hypothetical protein